MSREREDVDDPRRKAPGNAADRDRAERVARVIESVQGGTYQVRSEAAANRLLETMLRRPSKQ